jgi:hypothetical protein
MLRAARKRAKRARLRFNLTVEDVGPIPTNCPILNVPLRTSAGRPSDNSPALIRIDPQRGYVRGNVVIASYRAASIKNAGTVAELRLLLDFLTDRASR